MPSGPEETLCRMAEAGRKVELDLRSDGKMLEEQQALLSYPFLQQAIPK